MKTQNILMIAGGLLLVAGGASYLTLVAADHRAMAEARAGIDDSARTSVVDSRSSEDHVSQGSVGQSALAGKVIAVPQPSPAPERVAPGSTAVASVNVQNANAPQAIPAQPAHHRHDGLDHRAAALQATTPETEELVRESAKPDPSLPPPNLPVHQNADLRGGSSNDGRAMTDQLVRQSAQLDPALPPPDMSARVSTDSSTYRRSAKPGAGANPVAAAMTDQLVRQSAKLDPSLPPPNNGPAAAH
jgi:hypothetical protein